MIFVEADVRSSNIGLFSYDPNAGVPAAVVPDLNDNDKALYDTQSSTTLPLTHTRLAIHTGSFLRDCLQFKPFCGSDVQLEVPRIQRCMSRYHDGVVSSWKVLSELETGKDISITF